MTRCDSNSIWHVTFAENMYHSNRGKSRVEHQCMKKQKLFVVRRRDIPFRKTINSMD